MTVILAHSDHNSKTSWIGSDSCASDSINHSTVKNNKVFHPVGRRDVLLGCAGTFRLPNLLQFVPNVFPPENELATEDINMSYLINEFTPVIKILTSDFDDDDTWELLIAVEDRIYRMQMDLSIIEPTDDCDAVGIGGSVALGAFKVLNELEPDMPVEDRMKHALKVACDTCLGCQLPLHIKSTEKVPDEIREQIPTDREKVLGYEIIRGNGSDDSESIEEDEIELKRKRKKKKRRHCVE